MEHLKEIINIITSHKVKRIQIIGNPTNYASKTLELYEGIKSGRFTNDKDASEYFYGKGPKSEVNYKKLKARLQKRLINTIFFIDLNQPDYNEFQRAYYNIYKEWAATKILLGRAARRTAISIAERIINTAIRFEFNDLVLDIARALRSHYGSIEGNKQKFKRFDAIVKKHWEILNAELLAEEYYHNIVSNFINTKAANPKIEEMAVEYTTKLKKYTRNLHSYRLNLYAFLVFVLRYQISNDYKNMLIQCEQAIHYFESKQQSSSKVAIFTFLFKMLDCYTQLKKFDEGEIIANRCLKLLPDGSANWFFTLGQFLLLSFHANKLEKAYEIFCKSTEHKNFKLLYDNSAENWRVYEAYIYYFISIGAIKPPAKLKPRIQSFRIQKFLNEVPVYSKDKRGMNIPILIIHILFLLQKQDYDNVIDRVESLNQYCYRYLRKDDTYRSNCFIKMLLQLPKANFHKQGVLRKSKKYFNKLKMHPLNISKQANEIEIMPYEILWEYILASLDNKFHYTE